jgi:hypothetical protein
MRAIRRLLCSGVVIVALAGMAVSPVHAQAKVKVKHYAVSTDRAISVTRTVLVQRGYNVVRVERVGATQVVYYRVKGHKRGRGVGPMQRLVIRTVRDRVVFEEAEPSVLIDIDVKLN